VEGENGLGAKRRAENAIASYENCVRSYFSISHADDVITAVTIISKPNPFRYSLRSSQPWDYAAASVIVREAGCVITNWGKGEEANLSFDLFGPTMVCARSPAVHQELIKVLNNTS